MIDNPCFFKFWPGCCIKCAGNVTLIQIWMDCHGYLGLSRGKIKRIVTDGVSQFEYTKTNCRMALNGTGIGSLVSTSWSCGILF